MGNQVSPTKVSVDKDGKVVGIQSFEHPKAEILNTRSPDDTDPGDSHWEISWECRGHEIKKSAPSINAILWDSGFPHKFHASYRGVFKIAHVTRSAVAKVLGGKAADYEIIHV